MVVMADEVWDVMVNRDAVYRRTPEQNDAKTRQTSSGHEYRARGWARPLRFAAFGPAPVAG